MRRQRYEKGKIIRTLRFRMTRTSLFGTRTDLIISKGFFICECIGPVGSNHGSLARARARGAGSPRTAQSLLLALGRYRTQMIMDME